MNMHVIFYHSAGFQAESEATQVMMRIKVDYNFSSYVKLLHTLVGLLTKVFFKISMPLYTKSRAGQIIFSAEVLFGFGR
jgi:hypothetical protein